MSDYENNEAFIDATIVEEALEGILTGWWDTENSALEGCTVHTFSAAGRPERGLTLRLPHGAEFEITITKR